MATKDEKNMEEETLTHKIERLEALFPDCVTEEIGQDQTPHKVVDFAKLKQVLCGEEPVETESYEFAWVGKNAAFRQAHQPAEKTLRPCPEESKEWDTTQNLYLEGDNLEVLKRLQERYLGAVKMIYIDPPYNTGHDFVYPDSYRMDWERYNRKTGNCELEEAVHYTRTNLMTQGRYHSDWCSMIYPRLLLARDLLREDGAIFISIDDNEVDNLKKICAELFGSDNYVATFPWRKRTAKSDVPFGVSQDYEWVLCYAKSSAFMASVEGKKRKYYETPDFPGRRWRVHDLTKQTTARERPNSFFTIVNPKTGAEYPANPNRTWAITEKTFQHYYEQDRIVFPGDYPFLNIQKPVLRYWEEEDRKKAGKNFGRVAVSTKLPETVGMSQDGTKELTALFGCKVFSFPKPTALIQFFISIHTGQGDIVLDFFSGSATTAHAVLKQNALDHKQRKFILVQIPQPCAPNSDAYQAGYSNLCEIGKERIRRAGEQIRREFSQSAQDLDTGFQVWKLEESDKRDQNKEE